MIVAMADYQAKRRCTVEGCDRPHYGHGLCGMHYQRLTTHGRLETTRPSDYGTRKKHPLWGKWSTMRGRAGGLDPAWLDFWRFVADVGERPEGHMLEAPDRSAPLGPSNFRWSMMGAGLVKPRTRPAHCQAPGCVRSVKSSGLCKTHYERWRATGSTADPVKRGVDAAKLTKKRLKNHLAANYGLTVEQYEEMGARQNWECAICHRGGVKLSVDHCHETQEVRGLLCRPCNLTLGLMDDSPSRLELAAAYLTRHVRNRVRVA